MRAMEGTGLSAPIPPRPTGGCGEPSWGLNRRQAFGIPTLQRGGKREIQPRKPWPRAAL